MNPALVSIGTRASPFISEHELFDVDHDDPVLGITRIRFRRFFDMTVAFLKFRRLHALARLDPAFVRGQAMIADPHTIVNVSLWRTPRAMLLWTGGGHHVQAVQWTYGRSVETWSTYWSLMHESPSAQAWNGRVQLATSVRIGDHISS